MNTAIYAFSGDPITNGHINVIERALAVFDNIIVGIGSNPKKIYTFSLDEREEMATATLSKFGDRVKVVSFEGLLVDFAYAMNAKAIIRGIRNVQDFQNEYEMFRVNQTQKGIDTFFVCAGELLSHVSSSAVKELQRNHGDVHEYVPMLVKERLEQKISGQRIWGMTGEMGAGKSYLASNMRYIAKKHYGEDIDVIELDMIGKFLLTECTEPFAVKMRGELIQKLNLISDEKDGMKWIDPKLIGKLIFSDNDKLFIYNAITKEPIMFLVYRRLQTPGYKLITSALLVEAGITHICNNNVVIVHADKAIRRQRLEERKYSEKEIEHREAGQFSATIKRTMLNQAIAKADYGKAVIFKNDTATGDDIEMLYKNMFRKY